MAKSGRRPNYTDAQLERVVLKALYEAFAEGKVLSIRELSPLMGYADTGWSNAYAAVRDRLNRRPALTVLRGNNKALVVWPTDLLDVVASHCERKLKGMERDDEDNSTESGDG